MRNRNVVTVLTCLILAFVGSQSLQADLIPGITASTNMLWTNSTQLVNVVNGAGLPGNVPALVGTHYWPSVSNVWAS